jgi:alcohol dehydrogenase class IV
MRLISRSLVTAYKEPGNAQARADMMYGSVFGGMALTGSGTTAVHALAYPLGGKFKIAHGVANAILLPHVFEFNLEAVGSRVDEIAEAMEIDTGSDWRERGRTILDRIRGWVSELELPDDLSRWGVSREDLPVLAHAASQVTRLLVNNPRELSVSDIEGIYAKLLPIGGGAR